MSTNFYLLLDVCPHCQKSDRRVHIGKSWGNDFTWQCLRAIEGPRMTRIARPSDWIKYLKNSITTRDVIIDEDGEAYDPQTFLSMAVRLDDGCSWENFS